MDINQKKNFIENLSKDINNEMNEFNISSFSAFVRVVPEWLGYELEVDHIVDGAGDRGIDFWFPTSAGFDIFQVKSHELTNAGIINTSDFDNQGVLDLMRAKEFLLNDSQNHSTKLEPLIDIWNYNIDSKKILQDEEDKKIFVNLFLVIIGEKLTPQAQSELDAFKNSLSIPNNIRGVEVIFNLNLLNIDSLIEAKWREENREWKNIHGRKQDWIELVSEDREYLVSQNKSVIFYCKAHDLVLAYQNFGYQLFEPNVRCNIKKSKVNSDIKKSINFAQSRKEFKYLNNGITIVCNNYKKPSQNNKRFKVYEPGIVNGLQTVVSISEAYNNLKQNEKEDFENNCYVLVRVLQKNAVQDIQKVIRATNTQNKMESRNLFSNNSEQITYEKLFAEIGWFYERKDGAWLAFAMDPKRWTSLTRKKREHFLTDKNDQRSKVRKIDNEELAQCWFSFIGFSDIAAQKKKELFENENYYKLIFMKRPKKHAFELNYEVKEMNTQSSNSSPNPELLLLSFLARNFAKEMTPTKKESFEDACKKSNIDTTGKSKEEIIAELLKDDNMDYLLNTALSGMSYTYVEYLGYILFKALGDSIHDLGSKMLQNRSLFLLKDNYDFKYIKEKIKNDTFEKDDILCITWNVFKINLRDLINSYWGNDYRTAGNKSRLIAEKKTRKALVNNLIKTDKYTKSQKIYEQWAANIKPPDGLINYIHSIIKS